ncbi:DUF3095 domain-containing protein [Noviherbaspirillum denitrificans]|uniref:Adenylate cyclase n=1 Tax=Noviherbaspirillum denitrificans TaxID=1968433 RepID=A0A254TA86_9BURK|nr:DUF3095 domain-containing protein [Noviherbaspirillum denitrificans]OWW18212.1 hypothetical protein AYR66_01515 [Noviherbaspirillum denitrificans]
MQPDSCPERIFASSVSSSTDSPHFYRNIPAVPSFSETTAGRLHRDLPRDWWIAIADVAGSTLAIEAGAYKDVNTVGVACITAVLNVEPDIDLPFVFGGDGATLALPAGLRDRVSAALRGAQQLAREAFGLTLRVGLVSVASLTDDGHAVRAGKVQLSRHVTQATFSGNGWEEAERRVKTPDAAGVVRIDEHNGPVEARFDGFECRWKAFPSVNGHKLSLLVTAVAPDVEGKHAIYENVLARIQAIYGDVPSYHPLRAERMRLAFSPRTLSHEWRVRTNGLGTWQRIAYFADLLFRSAAGSWLFMRGQDTEATQWTRYRGDLVENSDFRKFDGMLRMLIDSSADQYALLRDYLEEECRAGRLAWGASKSNKALVTCIVRSYNGNHMHFVDGSDGGYALAARDLKRRLAQGCL